MKTATSDAGPGAVFFPGAGSFGSEFRSLPGSRNPGASVVRYPGRYGRDFGTPAASFEDLVRACAEQVSAGPANPVLFGHSFGAYVAYAVTLRLRESGLGIRRLVVAGANAPSRLSVPEQAMSSLSAARGYLSDIDSAALAEAPSEDWREIVAETAVSDLRLLSQFDPASSGRVHCPVLAIRGAADPLTSDAGIREWRHYTQEAFSCRAVPGGHSEFLRSADRAPENLWSVLDADPE